MKHSTMETIEFFGSWILFILLFMYFCWSVDINRETKEREKAKREAIQEELESKYHYTDEDVIYDEY